MSRTTITIPQSLIDELMSEVKAKPTICKKSMEINQSVGKR